jgi:hypothetical protein
MSCRSLLASLALSLAVATTADAQSVRVFTDRDAFLAAAGPNLVLEDFEDEAPGTTGTSRFLNNPLGVILSPNPGAEDPGEPTFEDLEIYDVPEVAAGGRRSVGGAGDPLGDPLPIARNISFFIVPVDEKPVFGIGFETFDLQTDLQLILSDSEEFARVDLFSTDGGEPGGQVRFFGAISDRPFSTASIRTPGGLANADFFTVDNVVFATVPEPSSLALAGIGGLGVGLVGVIRRRRRS